MANLTPQVIVRDSFARANSGTLGANWTANSDATTTGTMGIVSNAAQPSVGGNAASFWSANSFTANQYAQVIASGATGAGSHGIGPTVRGSAGGYYRFFANLQAGTNNAQIAKVVNGTFTSLINFTITVNVGDLLRLEIIGNQLTAYQNGTQVAQVSDSALTSGAPGVCGFMASASPIASMTTWEGGNLIWTRQGTVIAKTVGNGGGAQEPSVLYDINPQILSANPDGKIFKMWYTNGWTSPVVINYAESPDGITWTQLSTNPVINNGVNNSLHSFVFKNGSTYYAYVGNDLGANNGNTTQLDLWQSSNGTTWVKTNTAVLSIGGVGAWDHAEVDDPVVWVQGTQWFMLYQGKSASVYSTGLATSSDGITWTKYANNPVIPGNANGIGDALNGKTVVFAGGNYYLWGGQSPSSLVTPTDISIWSSPDLHTWTPATNNPIYERVTVDEGANLSSGQVADASLVEVNGTTYMFYDAIDTQAAGKIHINMANAPFTMNQLLGVILGITISGSSSSWLTVANANFLRGVKH